MLDLVMDYGEPEGDKTILSAKACRLAIEERKQLQKKLEHALKKDGLTVVMGGNAVITTHRANSFSTAAANKSRG